MCRFASKFCLILGFKLLDKTFSVFDQKLSFVFGEAAPFRRRVPRRRGRHRKSDEQMLEALRSVDAYDGVLAHDMNAAEYGVIAASSLAAYSVVAGHFDNG